VTHVSKERSRHKRTRKAGEKDPLKKEFPFLSNKRGKNDPGCVVQRITAFGRADRVGQKFLAGLDVKGMTPRRIRSKGKKRFLTNTPEKLKKNYAARGISRVSTGYGGRNLNRIGRGGSEERNKQKRQRLGGFAMGSTEINGSTPLKIF